MMLYLAAGVGGCVQAAAGMELGVCNGDATLASLAFRDVGHEHAVWWGATRARAAFFGGRRQAVALATAGAGAGTAEAPPGHYARLPMTLPALTPQVWHTLCTRASWLLCRRGRALTDCRLMVLRRPVVRGMGTVAGSNTRRKPKQTAAATARRRTRAHPTCRPHPSHRRRYWSD